MILACNMMTLHAPFILLGLLRNHHMHHLPTSDITQSSQDQIKLGINNTVVIIKWPQGAWSLAMILAQHHEYPTTRYPRYHGDHSGDHNHDQHLVSNRDPSGDHNELISNSDPSGDHNQLISSSSTSLLLLLLLTHSVTNYELGAYPRARLSIDLIYTL